MVFCAYCAGNALGPTFVYNHEAPQYKSAAMAMLGGYVGKTICHGLLGLYVSLLTSPCLFKGDADLIPR